MPSVRDKASHFSFIRSQSILSPALPKISRSSGSFKKWIKVPRRFDNLLKNRRLGKEMPRAAGEQTFDTSQQAPPRSPSRIVPKNALKRPSTSDSGQPKSPRDAEERGQNREGSPTSSRSGQAQRCSPAATTSRTLNVSQYSGGGRRAAEANQSDVKYPSPSAASLDYRIDQQLHYHKKRIVDALMAHILECIESKLDSLEDGCDGRQGSSSQPSSREFRSGYRKSQAAGQKRQLWRDEEEEYGSNDDGDNGSGKSHHKKPKKIEDDTRLKFACPYYKFDPQRFKNHRTCLGPGWPEVHRVKEHLKRSHMLPSHQCHRCFEYFAQEEQLKQHLRMVEPCAIKDPNVIRRDLANGFDKEQYKKLNKRTQKTSVEKWKEWFCILFEIDPASPDVPSPYHEIPYQSGGQSPSSDTLQEVRELYRTHVTPMIRHHVEQEVERAIMSIQDDIKSNVKDIIRDLGRRIMESIPLPNNISGDQDFNYLETLENFEFDIGEGFEFYDFSEQDILPLSESSESSHWSDQAMTSSATSVQDEMPDGFYSRVLIENKK